MVMVVQRTLVAEPIRSGLPSAVLARLVQTGQGEGDYPMGQRESVALRDAGWNWVADPGRRRALALQGVMNQDLVVQQVLLGFRVFLEAMGGLAGSSVRVQLQARVALRETGLRVVRHR
jgi:hypothetical protein